MPAAFGPLGIPGVAASTDLPANKVFLHFFLKPNKFIIYYIYFSNI